MSAAKIASQRKRAAEGKRLSIEEAIRRGSCADYEKVPLPGNLTCPGRWTHENALALEWDHLPGQAKSFGIGRNYFRSPETLLAELAKCEPVCRYHHLLRTRRRRDAEAAHSASAGALRVYGAAA